MQMLYELFCDYLRKSDSKDAVDLKSVMENECYIALKKIREIIRNEKLDDESCFYKIEEIVCFFESKGIDCGGRHDF